MTNKTFVTVQGFLDALNTDNGYNTIQNILNILQLSKLRNNMKEPSDKEVHLTAGNKHAKLELERLSVLVSFKDAQAKVYFTFHIVYHHHYSHTLTLSLCSLHLFVTLYNIFSIYTPFPLVLSALLNTPT